VDVEQILGRILRLPYTKKNKNTALNISYVITSSSSFGDTLDKVVKGLNDAGFSEKDYRPGAMDDPLETPAQTEGAQLPIPPQHDTDDDIAVDVDVEAVRARLDKLRREQSSDISDDPMFAQAIEQAADYENAIQGSGYLDFDDAPSEVRPFMNTKRMNKEFEEEVSRLRLPQFFVPDDMPEYFGNPQRELLTKEALLGDFTLADKDMMIDFSALDAEIARVDLEEKTEAVPKAFKLKGMEN
jgi:type III restriction enzyme